MAVKPLILPAWDTNLTNVVPVTAAHILDGWLAPGGVPEKPTFQEFNDWQNFVYRWIKSFNEYGVTNYDALLTNYVVGALTLGSDDEIYQGFILNGPAAFPTNRAIFSSPHPT